MSVPEGVPSCPNGFRRRSKRCPNSHSYTPNLTSCIITSQSRSILHCEQYTIGYEHDFEDIDLPRLFIKTIMICFVIPQRSDPQTGRIDVRKRERRIIRIVRNDLVSDVRGMTIDLHRLLFMTSERKIDVVRTGVHVKRFVYVDNDAFDVL